MIVLSLFDGMACGYEALKRAGIKVDKYYASEVDKHAIQIAKKNHPDIIHLGDINDWWFWDIEAPDIVMGGSPCQGFSVAGKQLAFDDPRSKLFFTMIDIINHYRPQYRLLENVRMKKEFQDIITHYMSVEPVQIDSALVSAQSRKRVYWFNWSATLPEDKGVLLKDIVDARGAEECKCGAIRGRYTLNKCQDHKTKTAGLTAQRLEIRKDGKTNTLTTVQKDNVCVNINSYSKISQNQLKKNAKCPDEKTNSMCGSASVTAIGTPVLNLEDGVHYRKLTPTECERLQTLQDGYTEGVSNTQRFKMLGNGWTVDVISHILGWLPIT